MKVRPTPGNSRRKPPASGDQLAIFVLVGLLAFLAFAVLGGLAFYVLRTPDALAALGLASGITLPAPLPTLPAITANPAVATKIAVAPPAAATPSPLTAASPAASATATAAPAQSGSSAAPLATPGSAAAPASATSGSGAAPQPSLVAASSAVTAPSSPGSAATIAATATPAAGECNLGLGMFVIQGNLASLEVNNLGSNTLRLSDLRLDWPTANGSLTEVRLNASAIAAPADAAPDTRLPAEAPWAETGNRGLGGGVSKTLSFEFSGPVQPTGYTAELTFNADCRAARQDSLTDTPAPPTASATAFLTPTPTPAPTGLPTLTPTFGPSPTASSTPLVTVAPQPSATPGCLIVINALNFDGGDILWADILNQEALPVTLVELVLEWSPQEPVIQGVALGGVRLWSGVDESTPTIISWLPPNHSTANCTNCHGDREFNWTAAADRVIPGGATARLEIIYQSPGPVSGVYHALNVRFENGCEVAKSN